MATERYERELREARGDEPTVPVDLSRAALEHLVFVMGPRPATEACRADVDGLVLVERRPPAPVPSEPAGHRFAASTDHNGSPLVVDLSTVPARLVANCPTPGDAVRIANALNAGSPASEPAGDGEALRWLRDLAEEIERDLPARLVAAAPRRGPEYRLGAEHAAAGFFEAVAERIDELAPASPAPADTDGGA